MHRMPHSGWERGGSPTPNHRTHRPTQHHFAPTKIQIELPVLKAAAAVVVSAQVVGAQVVGTPFRQDSQESLPKPSKYLMHDLLRTMHVYIYSYVMYIV